MKRLEGVVRDTQEALSVRKEAMRSLALVDKDAAAPIIEEFEILLLLWCRMTKIRQASSIRKGRWQSGLDTFSGSITSRELMIALRTSSCRRPKGSNIGQLDILHDK